MMWAKNIVKCSICDLSYNVLGQGISHETRQKYMSLGSFFVSLQKEQEEAKAG